MLKVLLKKQLTEIFQSFFVNRKKGTARSRAFTAGLIVLYVLLMGGVIGGMFTLFAVAICDSLFEVGFGWLYFLIFSGAALMLGVFGSVFNTFSGLYQSKDNDFLLSLPIPVRYILVARLLSVYVLGAMFSFCVMLPGIVVYFVLRPVTVWSVFGCVFLLFFVSALILVLSCLLGWVVAKINARLKNKNILTVAASLLFLAAYYFVYFKAQELIETLIENVQVLGEKVKGAAYPLYLLGRAGEGDLLSIGIYLLVGAALVALTYLVLSKSFLRLATSSSGTAKKKYVEKKVQAQSIEKALLKKEFGRFLGSPTYMLNCGLGCLFLPILSVLVLIKGRDLLASFLNAGVDFPSEILLVLACLMICFLVCMNDMTAPSVSLEGKNIWLVQSMPIEPKKVLQAKLLLQLVLTCPLTLLCSAAFIAVLRPGIGGGVLLVIFPQVFAVLTASFGLFLNLKRNNLSWNSEMIPVKQGFSVVVALFGAMSYLCILGGVYFAVGKYLAPELYLTLGLVLTAVLVVLLYRWILTKGAKIFAFL